MVLSFDTGVTSVTEAAAAAVQLATAACVLLISQIGELPRTERLVPCGVIERARKRRARHSQRTGSLNPFPFRVAYHKFNPGSCVSALGRKKYLIAWREKIGV